MELSRYPYVQHSQSARAHLSMAPVSQPAQMVASVINLKPMGTSLVFLNCESIVFYMIDLVTSLLGNLPVLLVVPRATAMVGCPELATCCLSRLNSYCSSPQPWGFKCALWIFGAARILEQSRPVLNILWVCIESHFRKASVVL